MKYISTYEECTSEERLIYDDCNNSWYWKVTNKYPDILIIFDKLGVEEGWGEWLYSEDNHLIEDFYLHKTKYDNGNIGWSYSGLDFKCPDHRKPPTYMGEVEITEEDRNKWKMKIDSKKYNL
jgi:hypothetical protein